MEHNIESPLVCRACLKIVEDRVERFEYIENSNGNLRDMMMCCVPEMDIYVSTDPIMCYPCIQQMVNAYNFKTRCTDTETIIRSYIDKNNLSECDKVNLSYVVQNLRKSKQPYKEQEEMGKISIKAEIVEDLPTQPDTKNVNSMPTQIISPLGLTISPFIIPAPQNNIPNIDPQSNVNIKSHVISQLPGILQQSSQNLKFPSSGFRNPLVPLPQEQSSTSVSMQIDQRNPMPPPTKLFSFQSNPKGPLFLVTPTIINAQQNNNLPFILPSATPPPLYFPSHSTQSQAEFSAQKKQPSVQEKSMTYPDIKMKNMDQPAEHLKGHKESKIRIEVRIPRSRITIPYEIKEKNFDNRNKDDGETSVKIENGIEDVKILENNRLSNESTFHRQANTHKEPNTLMERNLSKIYYCTCMFSTTSEHLLNEHKRICKTNLNYLVKCPHCPHTTSRPHAISKHISAMHTKAVWFICEHCTYRSTDKSRLKKHVDESHSEHAKT